MDKVSFADKFALIHEVYKPKLVAEYNDNKLLLTRVRGEFVWHKHDDTDDLFYVFKGRLTIQLRDRDVELNEGELFVVPRGVEHCPRTDEEAEILVIEPIGTTNTGDAETSEFTAEPERI
ncbi:MAG: cupin domain-containing protein [Solirubrobacteraceae bacterium]